MRAEGPPPSEGGRRAVGSCHRAFRAWSFIVSTYRRRKKWPGLTKPYPTETYKHIFGLPCFERHIQGSDSPSEPSDGVSELPTACRKVPTAYQSLQRRI